jgi:hypothetical protein
LIGFLPPSDFFDKLFPAKSKTSRGQPAKKSLEFLTNYFQLWRSQEKPIFSSHLSEKTPEYSGVFFRIFEENIGFCNI